MGKHLTYEQRCQIEALRDAGLGQAAIASAVGTSQSAISRELARNAGKREYFCGQAQAKAEARRSAASSTPRKMTKDVIAVESKALPRAVEPAADQRLDGGNATVQCQP